MDHPFIEAIKFILTAGGTITIPQLLEALYEIFTQKQGGSGNTRMTRRTNTTTTITEEFGPAGRWS